MGARAQRGLLAAPTLAVVAMLAVGGSSGAAQTPSGAVGTSRTVVWVRAHTRRRGCTASLRVRADGRGATVRVHGIATKRYLTTLTAGQRAAIRTSQRPRSRCRAVVTASGVLVPSRTGSSGRRSAADALMTDTLASPAAAFASAGEAPQDVSSPPEAPAASREGVELGTFDVVGAAEMRAWAASGGTAVVVPVIWALAQPDAGDEVSLASAGNSGQDVLSEIEEAHAAGLHVYLELDLQYPPAWVKQSVPSFVDQSGTAFSSEVPGKDVRDWIWSQAGREDVAAFVSGAMRALAPALPDVTGVRAGGGMYGEMQYPSDGSTVGGEPSFWGYDLPAQTGAGLAEGEQSTPFPGYVYGEGSPAQDASWASWYERSLGEFVHWYVTTLRADGWSGPVYVLEPSYGQRDNWSPRSFAYEEQVAIGTDYAVQLDSYDTLPDVWPWSTWADDAEPYYRPGDPVESDMSAWRELLVLAQQRGLGRHIMGENTGGGGSAAIERLTGGAMRAGYRGIFYLDYPALTADNDALLDSLISNYLKVLATSPE